MGSLFWSSDALYYNVYLSAWLVQAHKCILYVVMSALQQPMSVCHSSKLRLSLMKFNLSTAYYFL